MIDPRTHSDLLNWARWANHGDDGGPPVQRQAASAEGRHIPDADTVFEESQDKPTPIFETRARIVQGVYDSRLSHAERKVLQAEYAHRKRYLRETRRGAWVFSRPAAARTLGMPMRIYSEMLGRCCRLVREALG